MRYRNDCAGETHQELLQPFHRFRIQVVGRLVQQQHIGLAQQEFAQSDAAFFTAGQIADFCIPFRQAQRIGGDFQFVFRTAARGRTRRNNRFQAALLFRQRVKIRIGIGVLGIHFFQTFLRGGHFAQTAFHFLAYGFLRIKLRLLRQIADFDAAHRHGFTLEFLIHTRHNPQHGGLARAVQTEQADFRAGEEGKGNIFNDGFLRRHNLAHSQHRIDVLLGHGFSRFGQTNFRRPILTDCSNTCLFKCRLKIEIGITRCSKAEPMLSFSKIFNTKP